jgi:SAM-dependent methyltransferase
MVFRDLALQHAASYEGLDYEPRVSGVTYVTDIVAMKDVPRGAFDTILCFEVLEHVPDPWEAVAAMSAVLRPGGKILVTVPHLSRLHEQPHDYYRYTGYGLRALAESAGFEVVEISPHAGLASFIAHQSSTLLVGLAWGIPILQQAALILNRLLLVYPALWLDRVTRSSDLFPLGYVLVARKPDADD